MQNTPPYDKTISKLAKLIVLNGKRISDLTEKYTWLRNRSEAEYRARTADPVCVFCGRWNDSLVCPECAKRYKDILMLAGEL